MSEDIERVHGCLAGLAVGDAMGRPTELLFNYRRIEKRYGRVEEPVGKRAGSVTDDTRLTLTLADAILEKGGMVTADELVAFWKDHPEFTWRKFLRSYRRDEGFWIGEHIAAFAGRLGIPGRFAGYLNPSSLVSGNEAAMMMAPVGIIFRGRPGEAAAAGREVSAACVRGEAGRAAAMWAATVAHALSQGATVDSVLETALSLASPGMRACLDRALAVAGRFRDVFSVRPELYRCCLRRVTIDALETVPLALAMFRIAEGDPMTAIVGGTNLGRDSDTIAGMAGLLAGSLKGVEALDGRIFRLVAEVNRFDLEGYAQRLAALRC